MKAITITLFALIFVQSPGATRVCEDYITDEWPDYRYKIEIISGDNVVIDKRTGLMWKQCTEGLSGIDCMTGAVSGHNWKAAIELPALLNITGFAGYSDWRLPNVEELRSISAINCFDPSINEVAFPNTPADWFWSSTPVASNSSNAWAVIFFRGYDFSDTRTFANRVRLVRSGN